jgi:hypothetical protein
MVTCPWGCDISYTVPTYKCYKYKINKVGMGWKFGKHQVEYFHVSTFATYLKLPTGK